MVRYCIFAAVFAALLMGCANGSGSLLQPTTSKQLDISNALPVRSLQETAKAIFQIKIGGKDAGTAFLYKSEKEGYLFVTALHVVLGHERTPGAIELQSGEFSINVQSVVVPSIKYDLAFLKVLPVIPSPTYYYFEINTHPLKSLVFSEIQMVSYGLFHADYRTPFLSNGNLQLVTPFSLILTLLPTNIGSSGGPVFLKENYKLLGMLTKEITLDDRIQRGVASAISIDVIESLASDNINP